MRGEDFRQLVGECFLVGVELALRELGTSDQLAQPAEERRLERRDGQPLFVGGRVDPVARKSAGEQAWHRLAREPVRCEPMRAVRHGDHDVRTPTRALAHEQRGEDLGDGRERTRREVGDLHRRRRRRGVREYAGPAEVVEVVRGAPRMRLFHAEAGDRAVHRRLRHVVRPDAEPRGDARAKALEHDVGMRDECPPESRFRLQVADHRFLSGVQCVIPGRCDRARRVAGRRLEPDDTRPEPQQLPARERTRQIAGEIDDQEPVQWPHAGRNL